jgi:hypothetical protein
LYLFTKSDTINEKPGENLCRSNLNYQNYPMDWEI